MLAIESRSVAWPGSNVEISVVTSASSTTSWLAGALAAFPVCPLDPLPLQAARKSRAARQRNELRDFVPSFHCGCMLGLLLNKSADNVSGDVLISFGEEEIRFFVRNNTDSVRMASFLKSSSPG